MESKFEDYLRNIRRLAPQTVEAYLSDLKIWQEFLDKSPTAGALDLEAMLTHFIINQSALGSGPRSLNRKLSAVKAYALALEDEPLLAALKDFDRPRFDAPLPAPPSKEEVKELLMCVPTQKTRTRLILQLLYSTGLRVSELTNLRLSQINLMERYLRIKGKGAKFRLVPFDAQTASLLEEYFESFKPSGKSGYIFATRNNRPLTRQAVWKIVKIASRDAGLAEATSPHTLRHAYATHLLENNVNLRALQMFLGHSDLSTTQVYTHVSREQLRKILDDCHPLAKSKDDQNQD